MYKIIPPDSQDFDEPRARLIKASSRGLIGEDKRRLIKLASLETARMLEHITSLPGEELVHMIALGSTESIGNNRNGDGFKNACCEKYHDTFVKKAKPYRDHQNKHPHPYFGIVKASAFNRPMGRIELVIAYNATKEAADRNGGQIADKELDKINLGKDLSVSMSCVTNPDFPVLTRDHGYVRIADVVVGDYVWTHKGRWRRVTQLNRRPYTGEVFEFRVNGMPMEMELTADHPMWAKIFEGARTTAAMQWKSNRYFKDTAAFERVPAGWHHASHVGVGDRFFYQPITRYEGYGQIDCPVLATIMGYYLAEGSLGYNGEKASVVEFTCHMDDSLPRRLPALVESLFPDVTVSIRPKPNSACSLSVCIFNTKFAQFIRKYVGKGCHGKLIPPEIFNAGREVQLAFLGAWLDGDGWLDKKGGHWSTVSPNLVLQGRDLLCLMGIPASIYRIDRTNRPQNEYGNYGNSVEYTLNISHVDMWNLTEYAEKAANYPAPARKKEQSAYMRLCPDGSYAYRVSQVKSRFVSDIETYNFEVEEDESYSLGGFISHNCRVPWDVCSSCGNKAAHRGEYCTKQSGCKHGGLRDNIGKVFSDGHVLHADNPDPEFFDISHVLRPADRIAYAFGKLEKAANLTAGRVVSGVELAEAWGLEPRRAADTPKITKLASSLAALASSSSPGPLDLAAPYGGEAPSHLKPADALAALAKQGCVMPPAVFLAFLGRTTAEKCAAAADSVTAGLAGAFSALAQDPQLEALAASSPYRPAQAASMKAQKWAAAQQGVWGLDTASQRHRIHQQALKGVTAGRVKSAAVTPASQSLAKEYALYCLHALAEQPAQNLPLAAEAVARLVNAG